MCPESFARQIDLLSSRWNASPDDNMSQKIKLNLNCWKKDIKSRNNSCGFFMNVLIRLQTLLVFCVALKKMLQLLPVPAYK